MCKGTAQEEVMERVDDLRSEMVDSAVCTTRDYAPDYDEMRDL